jgi:hypothetical protein
MAGSLPTKGRKIVIDDFSGASQVFDDALLPTNLVRWVYGCIDVTEQHMARLGGKYPLLNHSSLNESVVSMGQLTFASSSYILTQSTSHREMYDTPDAMIETYDGISEYGI